MGLGPPPTSDEPGGGGVGGSSAIVDEGDGGRPGQQVCQSEEGKEGEGVGGVGWGGVGGGGGKGGGVSSARWERGVAGVHLALWPVVHEGALVPAAEPAVSASGDGGSGRHLAGRLACR